MQHIIICNKFVKKRCKPCVWWLGRRWCRRQTRWSGSRTALRNSATKDTALSAPSCTAAVLCGFSLAARTEPGWLSLSSPLTAGSAAYSQETSCRKHCIGTNNTKTKKIIFYEWLNALLELASQVYLLCTTQSHSWSLAELKASADGHQVIAKCHVAMAQRPLRSNFIPLLEIPWMTSTTTTILEFFSP